jgi:hypothetical protein
VPSELFFKLDPVRWLSVPENRVDRFETGTGETVFIGQLAVHLENGVRLLRYLSSFDAVNHSEASLKARIREEECRQSFPFSGGVGGNS